MSTFEEITLKRLDEQFGGGRHWWNRHRPQLVKAGIISKKGRKFFGVMEDVASWLRGRPSNVNVMALNMACASAGAKR